MSAPTRIPPGTTTFHTWRGLLMFCAATICVATLVLQVAGRFAGPSLVVLELAMLAGLLLLGAGGRGRARAGAAVVGVFSLVNNIHAGLFMAVICRTGGESDRLRHVHGDLGGVAGRRPGRGRDLAVA